MGDEDEEEAGTDEAEERPEPEPEPEDVSGRLGLIDRTKLRELLEDVINESDLYNDMHEMGGDERDGLLARNALLRRTLDFLLD